MAFQRLRSLEKCIDSVLVTSKRTALSSRLAAAQSSSLRAMPFKLSHATCGIIHKGYFSVVPDLAFNRPLNFRDINGRERSSLGILGPCCDFMRFPVRAVNTRNNSSAPLEACPLFIKVHVGLFQGRCTRATLGRSAATSIRRAPVILPRLNAP